MRVALGRYLNMKVIILFFIFMTYLKLGKTQCSASVKGENNPSGKAGSQDGNSNTGYLLLGTSADYKFDCCGAVSEWQIVSSGTGTIYFQIWRLSSGTDYTLVGENEVTVGVTGFQILGIAAGDQISVRPDDRFGWYASGTNLVEHKSAGGSPDNTILAMGKPSVGQTVSWASATTISTQIYAIRAEANGGSGPSIDSPADGTTHAITNDVAVGHFIETVTWSDPDVGDDLTISRTANTKFDFTTGTGTGNLTVATSLSGPDSTEVLVFTVTDYCGNAASATVTVVINNEAPVIHDMPAADTLLEDTTAKTLVYTINATDTADPVTCSFSTVVTDPFVVEPISGSSNYGIYVNANAGLDYDTQSAYAFTVVCSDGYENSNTGTFYLYLVENQPPVIHNLQAATTLSTTSAISTVVFTVNSTDNEGDTLTYTMTCDPPSCPLQIFSSGQILLNTDISGYSTVGYDISVNVSDGRSTTGPKTLTVIIQNINDPVLISNLPLTSSITVAENTVLSTSVFTVSLSDQDTQTWTFSSTSTPGTGSSYFSLDSAGLISTAGTVLNYETLAAAGTTSFTFTITVNDGTASDTEPLVIDVINVNEAPQFPQNTYSLSTTEGGTGDIIGTPPFSVTDQDSGDSHTFAMDCGTETAYFLMDSTSGEVSFQSVYDLDAGLPTTVTCTVTTEDTGGLTDTATLYIYISNVNDNTPVFSPASYSFFISCYASVGTAVGTVTATDSDNGTFGTLTYTLDQTSLPEEYFSVDNSGQITVLRSPTPLNCSTTVTINVTATDGGGLSDVATVTIVISDTTTTSTTTTTDRYRTFIEDTRNIPWLVACIIILVVIIGLLIWTIYTCHGDKSFTACKRRLFKTKKEKVWRPRPRRPPTPQSPSRPNKLQSFLVSVRRPPPPKGEQVWRSSS